MNPAFINFIQDHCSDLRIAYPDPYYDHSYVDEFPKELENEIIDKFNNLLWPKKDILKLDHTDFGTGADWPFIVLSALIFLFFSGKKINDNINAWEEIIRKIHSFFKNVKEQEKVVRINKDLAIALAINSFLEVTHYELENINSITCDFINSNNLSMNKNFRDYPDEVRLNIEIENSVRYEVSANSNGDTKVKQLHEND